LVSDQFFQTVLLSAKPAEQESSAETDSAADRWRTTKSMSGPETVMKTYTLHEAHFPGVKAF